MTSTIVRAHWPAQRRQHRTKLRAPAVRLVRDRLNLASGGDIFKLSKILGHSSVAITQQVYAHLHPDAFAEDYSRVSFAMPEKTGTILSLHG